MSPARITMFQIICCILVTFLISVVTCTEGRLYCEQKRQSRVLIQDNKKSKTVERQKY